LSGKFLSPIIQVIFIYNSLIENMIPKLRAPIVLVHGLFGFDRIRVGGLTVNYFPGIQEGLKAAGNRVLIPCLSPTGGVDDRARQLKSFIQRESPGEPVHILAHSMGGLDSRYMVSRMGMDKKVLTLTTLGTPHRGTPFADWGVQRLERIVKPFFQFVGLPTQAFYDLTTAGCRAFNDLVPDAPGVRYFSVAGKIVGDYLNPEFLVPYHIVLAEEGPNDGVVSIDSASYGERTDVWEGDHLSLVNWLNPLAQNRSFWRKPAARYGPLLRRLADEGF
jgi:triacylglycerol lipase